MQNDAINHDRMDLKVRSQQKDDFTLYQRQSKSQADM